jgi:hypothetical protein
MPRNSSGTYTLPAGNPVAPNTVIETAWANPTMSDVASGLTDSLDRYGRGTMLSAFKLTDGAAATPALTWNSEASSGLYRAGSHDIRLSVAGVDMLQATDAGIAFPKGISGTLSFAGVLKLSDGTAPLPSLAFTNSPTTGLFRAAADILGVATAGVERMRVNETGLLLVGYATPVLGTAAMQINGTLGVTEPSTAATLGGIFGAGNSTAVFTTDTDKVVHNYGLVWKKFSDQTSPQAALSGYAGVRFYTSGTLAGRIDASGNHYATGRFIAGNDTAASPGYSWANRNDTGMFRTAAADLGFATVGAERMRIDLNGRVFVGSVQGLGIAGAYMHQVAGSYLAFGDNVGIRALNGSANGATSLFANPGSAGGGTLNGEGGPIVFAAGGGERARLTPNADPQLLIGQTAPTYGSSGRALLEVNGGAGSIVALNSGGSQRGYIFGDNSHIEIAAMASMIMSFVTNGQVRGTIDSVGVFNYAGVEVGWKDMPVVSVSSGTYTLSASDRGKLIAAGGTSNVVVPVGLPAGSVYTIMGNMSGATIAINPGSGVHMYWGSGSTLVEGVRQIANLGLATILNLSSGSCIIKGDGLT